MPKLKMPLDVFGLPMKARLFEEGMRKARIQVKQEGSEQIAQYNSPSRERRESIS